VQTLPVLICTDGDAAGESLGAESFEWALIPPMAGTGDRGTRLHSSPATGIP
jgi:hypothetical protein